MPPIKITQYGIDTVQDNIISSSKIQDNSISTSDVPVGLQLQTINNIITSRTSYTSYTYDTDVPGMSLTIVPKENNSKFQISIRSFFEIDDEWNTIFNIQRNGTRVNVGGLTGLWSGLSAATQTYSAGDNNDSTPSTLKFTILDETGSTKNVPITFKLVSSSERNMTAFFNRTFGADNQSGYENSTSEIIITEIKG